METRHIKINDAWYTISDTVLLDVYHEFLFFKWITKKKWKIIFIGVDACAEICDGKYTKTIIGEVTINIT